MKIGVLGLGFMGSTHIEALAAIPGAELAAVMDADEERLAGDLAGIQGNLGGPGRRMDFSGIARYRSIDEIVRDPSLDAVDICLPTFLHAPAAVAALSAAKHVLVEKPMALDGATAEAICSAAATHGRILMAAQVVRFFPAYRELAKLVKSGALGRVRWAMFRRRTAVPGWGPWEFDKAKSGGGVFDLLIHDVDMALHLFGAPRAIRASGHEDMAGGIDMITAAFEYPDIGSVTITGGWHHAGTYPFSMEYTVVGDRGVVEFSSAGRPATVYWSGGESEALPCGGPDPYRAEIEYFLGCCARGEQPALCPPAESVAAVRYTRDMVEARGRG